MSEVTIFNHNMFGEIRSIGEKDNQVWFVAKDVAKSLCYSNTKDAIGRHCKGVVKRDLPTNSGVQTMSVIPEGDIYRLVMRSKLPTAEKFEAWVVDEVLPSIRKNGGYIINQENETPEMIMARALQVANNVINEHQQKLLNKQKELDEEKLLTTGLSEHFAINKTVYDFCKELNGVNVQKVQNSLVDMDVFFREGKYYRVKSRYRDTHFTERSYDYSEYSTSYTIYPTHKGCKWLYKKYLDCKLPMKKTWDNKFTHLQL